jgi:hypothetical protein
MRKSSLVQIDIYGSLAIMLMIIFIALNFQTLDLMKSSKLLLKL